MSALRLRTAICLAVALCPCLPGHASNGWSAGPLYNGLESSLASAERRMGSSAVHGAEFAALSANREACEASSQPQALATPNSLLDVTGAHSRITVSFIIGVDGRIQSPLILSSDTPSQDGDILRTVRTWRYRPALCNGVPTETETRVEFSSR
ncbi:MAG: hypothetical protein DMG90_07310 [Acidobacteria bacterium]|nr:MAG: hypothetical protein DMG90_07310 [Acidobacteriota bacterium]